jgi:hypothetical protein
MNIQELWTRALREGIYPQTRMRYAYLVEPDGYTACGVLCSLALTYGIIRSIPERSHAMPIEVQYWAQLRVPHTAPFSLDDEGRTFLEMANLIDDHADKLFNDV